MQTKVINRNDILKDLDIVIRTAEENDADTFMLEAFRTKVLNHKYDVPEPAIPIIPPEKHHKIKADNFTFDDVKAVIVFDEGAELSYFDVVEVIDRVSVEFQAHMDEVMFSNPFLGLKVCAHAVQQADKIKGRNSNDN